VRISLPILSLSGFLVFQALSFCCEDLKRGCAGSLNDTLKFLEGTDREVFFSSRLSNNGDDIPGVTSACRLLMACPESHLEVNDKLNTAAQNYGDKENLP
jgi:hypothetical protein